MLNHLTDPWVAGLVLSLFLFGWFFFLWLVQKVLEWVQLDFDLDFRDEDEDDDRWRF